MPYPDLRDNYTFWRPSFERDYYERLISSTEGITERVRPDLTDPEDGRQGINIAGYTMRTYYAEQSGGRMQFDTGPKGVIGWVGLPHSEAYYAADACTLDPETNTYSAGGVTGMDGLPQNTIGGPAALAADVIKLLNEGDPNFPWDEYDVDGNGVIDHVVFVHAGEDRARGGPYTAHWAHRGQLPNNDASFIVENNGTADPADDIRMSGYTMQYEALDLGVLAHEFGHDLGLPDLYSSNDTDADTSVGWWDLMGSGSNNGKLAGFPPSGMSAWTRFALGWTDPELLELGANPRNVQLGQAAQPPPGTTQAVRVNLTPTELVYTELPEGSTRAYWTNNDQNWADVRLTRDLDLSGQTAPISISFDIEWNIEEDWDYLFFEVSVDGGQTYTQTRGFEVGSNEELTTPEDYDDPNGRLNDYGGLRYGYTGQGGWLRAYHNLSPYAGEAIKVRFRYATDAALIETGAFIDNLKVTAGSTVILDDPAEGDSFNGWTPTVASFATDEPLGEGWQLSTGVASKPLYYLAEWRSFAGFDKALRFTPQYAFNLLNTSGQRERRATYVPSNLPGMLVWLRDTRFGNEPFNTDQSILEAERFASGLTNQPSEGPKGGLLLVDAHPAPLRGPFNRTIDLGFGAFAFPPFNNWNGLVQSTNGAFGLNATPQITLTAASGAADPATTVLTPTTYAPLPAVSGFHDALGYYPGVEALPQPVKTFEGESGGTFLLRLKPYAFADPDASVVVPARGYYPPRTPPGFTGRGAEESPPSANVSSFETIYADSQNLNIFGSVNVGAVGGTNVTGEQTGNPGDYDVQYGYHFEIITAPPNGTRAVVRFYQGERAAVLGGGATRPVKAGDPVTVTVTLTNVGSAAPLAVYSDFDEEAARYVEGSATNGAIPVRSTRAAVDAAVAEGGLAALQQLAVEPGTATALVWASPRLLAAGESAGFSYRLTPAVDTAATTVVNQAVGVSSPQANTRTLEVVIRERLFLPQAGR